MSQQATWGTHLFTVYDPAKTSWNDVSGIYIFCGISAQNRWVPLYIGQADSFRNRIPSHERWSEAVRLGATYIHTMVVRQEANRAAIERLLIQTFQPTLNTQHRSLLGTFPRTF